MASSSKFTPLAPAAVNVTSALSGTVVTGPDGFFAFPLAEAGDYWLRAEKDGYTYGQREAEVVQDRSTATNAIYLARLDPAETLCDEGGCTHTSSDGLVELEIPAGAISAGEVVTTTATNLEHVEFLPSGELPGDTWETYAFNLGGDSDYVFQEPITIRLKNELGFSPGTEIPLGFWNQATQAWEHAGAGVVDATGQWVEMEATHFSFCDSNFPIAPPENTNPYPDDKTDGKNECKEGEPGCFVGLKSGTFEEDITLPTVNVLGEEIAPALLYNSDRASPAEVIDVKLSLNVGPDVELGDYIGFELYIEGQKTDSFVFSSTLQTGEMGRYRYLWDGRDAQGNLLPPGVYEYAVKLGIPYRGQYCQALDGIFGNPPDCVNGATGIFVDATEDVWVRGTIESNAQPDSPLGAGWVLDGLQRLYEDQAGRIMVVDGQREDEFYFPQKEFSSNADTSRLLAGSITAPLLDTSTPQPTTELPLLEPLPETTLPVPERPAPELVRESEPPAGESVPEAIAPSPEAVARPKPPQLEALPPYQEMPLSQGALACGQIVTDTVWTAATGIYTVTCDVSVQAGVTLTIEPGVIVQFEHSGDDLVISGGLQAVGTEFSSIVFQPVTGTIPGSWGRLAFLTGSSGILDHTVLEYGGSENGLLYLASDQVQLINSAVQYSANTGIVIAGASPLISGTQILSNTASSQGGGIYNYSGSPTIQNNTFRNNSATANGGGIYNSSGSPTIQNNTFRNNSDTANGGGIFNGAGSPTIQNNTFQGNSVTGSGGGIFNSSGSPTIQNNTFQGNSATSGGGILNSSGSTTIQNNTCQGNSATGGGGGIFNSSDSPTIRNNVIVSNTATALYGKGGGIYFSGGGGMPDVDYNDVWNNGGGDYWGVSPGPHDISADPLFVDAEGSDFHLASGSPCIDAGDPDFYPETDFEGEPRPMGLPPDIGADEYGMLGIFKTSLPGEVALGQTFTYSVQLVNLESVTATTVVVTDDLPVEVAFVDYQADGVTCTQDGSVWGGTVQCVPDGGSLLPGETRELTLTVAATDTLPAPRRLTNVITATARAGGAGRAARDQAETWVTWCRVRLNDGPVGTDLQAAINASTQPTDVVRVSGHCLLHDITLDRTLTLQGGWSHDFSVRDTTVHTTTLDAQGMGRVLLVSGDVSPIIEGFVVTGGLADDGGGIYIFNSSPTIQDNTFQGNSATGLYGYGGGIYISSGSPTIQDNTFQGNSATYGDGGGIYHESGNPTIQDNTFQGNSAAYGGGIYHESGNPTIQNNTFLGNSATGANGQGGGIYNRSGSPTIQDNTFLGNSATYGGGIYNWSGSPTIQNNTFLGNSTTSSGGGQGGGIYNRSVGPTIRNNVIVSNTANSGGGIYNWSGSLTIRNNIIVSNTANSGGGIAHLSGTPPDVDYNDVWDNGGGDYYGVSPGPHDISADPWFVDAQGGDFHLALDSPCIDAGDPDNYPETDFEGDPRPMGLASDIGADEFRSEIPSSRTATDYSILTYDPNTATYTRVYPDGSEVHFNPAGTHDFTLEPGGRKTVYAYNSDGTVATMGIIPTGEDAPRWTWTFDYVNGKLSSITDPSGRVTSFTVDTQGNLTQVTTPDGATQGFAYDANHLMTHYTDQNGAVTTHAYDSYGRIANITEPPRAVYDPDTGQVEVIQEVRNFTPSDTAYPLINDSPVGDPKNPAPPVPLSADLVDSVTYGRGGRSGHINKWGNWLDETDGIGRTTTYESDDRNNLTRKTYPNGDCVEYTYDEGAPRSQRNVLSEARMGAAQCALAPADRDPAQVQTWTYTYEEQFNQIKTETDPLGNTTTYVYDYEEGVGDAGNLIRIEYPPVPDENGTVVTPTVQNTYNAWGFIETKTDQRGTVTRYVYTQGTPDEASGGANPLFAPGVTPVPGLLTQQIEDDGDASHLNLMAIYKDFDGAGNPGTILGPGCCGQGQVTHYTYDALGRVLTEEDALGIVTRYAYDGRGNLVERIQDYTSDGTTGRNVVTTYLYDVDDRLLQERTAADGIVQETTNTYDINGNLATQTNGNGNTTIYGYDDVNQLIAMTDPLGYTTTYSYTLKGEPASVTQPDGDTTRTVYDAFGRRVQEILDEGGLNLNTSYTYDLNGNSLTKTDAVGTVTCYTYDALNRLASETRDCGGLSLTTTYAYDVGGNLVRTTDERGVVTLDTYDAIGRRISTRLDAEGLNLETTYAYDEAFNLISATDERGVVTGYEYDARNRQTAVHQDAAGLDLTTSFTYDRLDYRLTATEPNGIVTLTEHNAFGQPTRRVDDYAGLNAETQMTYDSNLNLLAITDANSNTTLYSYNGRDDQTQIFYADGSTVNFGYNPDGTQAWRIDQAGDRVDFAYDGADRLLSKTYPDGSTQTFGYDAIGHLTSAGQTMSGHTSLVSFTYNALGDITSATQAVDGLSWTTIYLHDYATGIVTVTYPSGAQVARTQDALRRLSQVQQDGSLVASYTYDDVAGTITLTHANGVSTVIETDTLRRTTRVNTVHGGTLIADYRYGYDPAGNRTYMQRVHESGQPADVYEYDELYQLTQVWYGADATEPGAITGYDRLQWYDLDDVGNRLEVQNDGSSEIYLPNDGARLTNPMNRYQQVDARPFGYDAKGNLLNDSINTYSYDYESRQTGMTGPGGTAGYVYDALGRRVAAIVDGVVIYYVYNNVYQVIEERDASDQLIARYTYGVYVDEPLTMERGGVTHTYHRDAQFSITEVTDATGAEVERYTYDVYGTPRIYDGGGAPLPASTIGNTYLFTGRRYDVESENYYYRARIYTPEVGRFLQMDPLGYVDGMNLYAYVGNNPVVRVDPSGNRLLLSECDRKRCKEWHSGNPTKHGCWCGKGNSGVSGVWDMLDAACREHDKCYDRNGLSFSSPRTLDKWLCDDPFCQALKRESSPYAWGGDSFSVTVVRGPRKCRDASYGLPQVLLHGDAITPSGQEKVSVNFAHRQPGIGIQQVSQTSTLGVRITRVALGDRVFDTRAGRHLRVADRRHASAIVPPGKSPSWLVRANGRRSGVSSPVWQTGQGSGRLP